MTNPLTESGLQRKLTEFERQLEAKRIKHSNDGRSAENLGFRMAIVLIGLRSLLELMQESGFVPHREAGFPWGFWAFCLLLVLPKVVNRASYGKFWEFIGLGIGTRIGGSQIPNARKDDER